jgi:hypothetical protein
MPRSIVHHHHGSMDGASTSAQQQHFQQQQGYVQAVPPQISPPHTNSNASAQVHVGLLYIIYNICFTGKSIRANATAHITSASN